MTVQYQALQDGHQQFVVDESQKKSHVILSVEILRATGLKVRSHCSLKKNIKTAPSIQATAYVHVRCIVVCILCVYRMQQFWQLRSTLYLWGLQLKLALTATPGSPSPTSWTRSVHKPTIWSVFSLLEHACTAELPAHMYMMWVPILSP